MKNCFKNCIHDYMKLQQSIPSCLKNMKINNKVKQQKNRNKMHKPNHHIKFLLLILLFHCIHTQNQNAELDRQTQHIQQFARTMADFIPTETFTFTLGAGEQQNFALWPAPQVQKIRGVFYIDNSQDPESINGDGFFVGCEMNGVMEKTFVNERLGVFTLNPRVRPINIKLIFKSDIKPLTIYVSYQLKKPLPNTIAPQLDQNVPTKQQQQLKQKKSRLDQVTQKFKHVQTSVQSQQNSLRMILKLIGKHSKRLQTDLKYSHYRIAIQTIVVLLSGLLGIWIIKKQMNSGYQLLV